MRRSRFCFALFFAIMEEDILDLDWNNASVQDVGSRTLVGKIMTKRNLNRNTVKSMILKGWNVKKEVKIVDGENGVFLFSFEDNDECARVLRDRPWLILGFLLIVQERSPYVPINEMQWRLSPYWIQIHGLPIEGFTESNILKIGARFGEVMEYECPIVNNVIVRSFFRIRVWIDVEKPILDGFWISRPGLGKCWIDAKMEKLQIFCFKCGVISHDAHDCDEEKAMSVVNPDFAIFGAWNGTVPCRNSEVVVRCSEMEGVEAEARKNEEVPCKHNEVRSDNYASSSAGSGNSNKCKRLFDGVEKVLTENNDNAVVLVSKDRNVDAMQDRSVYSYVDRVVEEGDKENQSDFSLRRSVRRRKPVNVKDMKMLARGGDLCSNVDEISCSNVDYFVEFPKEDLGDNMKRRMSGEIQKELVDNMKAVNLKKNVSGRNGKKARAGGLNRESVVSGKEVYVSKEAVIIEKKFSVLNEVKRWELGELSRLADSVSPVNAVAGRFSFGATGKEVSCEVDEGCSGWPQAATKEV